MLLVATDLVPQQMRLGHLNAVTEFLTACSCSVYFNSWCGGASVNHFHCHLIHELPPVARLPLVPGAFVLGKQCQTPDGFPGSCYVFNAETELATVDVTVRAMQEDNQPHNILFIPPRSKTRSQRIYIFPKPHARPSRSLELYPCAVGGPELLGCFTLRTQRDFDSFSSEMADEVVRINTAELPMILLRRVNRLSNLFIDVKLSSNREHET